MSANLVSPKHINATATIVKACYYPERETALVDIRLKLARANAESVLYRYSAAGRAWYDENILPQLAQAGWAIDGALKKLPDMLPDEMPGLFVGQSFKEWLWECRQEQPHQFEGDQYNWTQQQNTKALLLLGRYDYQACEVPNYSENEIGKMIHKVMARLGSSLAHQLHPERYDIDEDE